MNVLGCIQLLEEIIMQGRELTQFVTDFTWYLRNLMLVSTADNLEDVIDMSSDNLVRLKEESKLIQIEQIVRYIHVFSNLSNQIKYASQKRILIEIALIKLCKPSMEVNQEALAERILDIEQQIENGISISTPEYNTTMVEQEKPKIELPKAIPDDIKQIVTKWSAIVGQATQPMKNYLKAAKLSLGGDNKLQVVVEDGISSDYFLQNLKNKELLEEIISDYIGKQVEVTIQSYQTQREFQNNYVDLSQIIHMEIEEEED